MVEQWRGGPGGGEVKKVNVYIFGYAQNVYKICVPHCVHCVWRVYLYIYIRRRIDFSPRVDASGGADGLRTTVVVVVVTRSARRHRHRRRFRDVKKK